MGELDLTEDLLTGLLIRSPSYVVTGVNIGLSGDFLLLLGYSNPSPLYALESEDSCSYSGDPPSLGGDSRLSIGDLRSLRGRVSRLSSRRRLVMFARSGSSKFTVKLCLC